MYINNGLRLSTITILNLLRINFSWLAMKEGSVEGKPLKSDLIFEGLIDEAAKYKNINPHTQRKSINVEVGFIETLQPQRRVHSPIMCAIVTLFQKHATWHVMRRWLIKESLYDDKRMITPLLDNKRMDLTILKKSLSNLHKFLNW